MRMKSALIKSVSEALVSQGRACKTSEAWPDLLTLLLKFQLLIGIQ